MDLRSMEDISVCFVITLELKIAGVKGSWNGTNFPVLSANCVDARPTAYQISMPGSHIYSQDDSDVKAFLRASTDMNARRAGTRTFWVMREGEQADARCAGARAKNGHSFWVSFESLDVFFDPPESLNLIQEAIVALGCLVSCAEKTCIDENIWQREKKNMSALLLKAFDMVLYRILYVVYVNS